MRDDYKDRVYLFNEEMRAVYLSNVVTAPYIEVGEHTYYHDYEKDPRDFQKNNVLYYAPEFYQDKLVIGKYCSLACGTTFIGSIANHSLKSAATYPFGIANAYWELPMEYCTPEMISNLPGKGPTVVGNDVWFGYQSLVMPGVKIGDGAIIGTRSVVTKDVEPYTIVGGSPARVIRKRYDDASIAKLLELKWWDLPDNVVRLIIPDMVSGNMEAAMEKMEIARTAIKMIEELK